LSALAWSETANPAAARRVFVARPENPLAPASPAVDAREEPDQVIDR
jgi:hypothetical protein